eukprot:GHVP01049217.1.p1 GENE.GHVP01049217.1~~GHVP01049217.1.p1  ORF type:complete len:105 (-),score=5.93 GHVP01049217.1:447-761(-)
MTYGGNNCTSKLKKREDYNNFSIVGPLPGFFEVEGEVQPYNLWLKELNATQHRFCYNYYFFWGTSVFKLYFDQYGYHVLQIWHPAMFQRRLYRIDNFFVESIII